MLLLRSARALQHIARPALRRTHLLATRSELEALTVPVLKDRLRSLSLKVGGKKGELVERLLASDASDAATTEDTNGATEAEPVVVDGVRVIDVGDDYDWGFDDDEDEDEDAGTDMADRLARASAGDVGHGGARASHDERRGAPDFAIEVGAGNCGGCGAPFQCADDMKTGYVPPSVYARLNLAGEDDDSPEAEVERLLAEARAGRQEAEVEVDEEDLAMDEDEFEELLMELEEEELEEAEAADVRKFERAEAKRQRNAVPICQRCHGLRHQKKGGEATRARAGAADDALTPEAFEGLIIDEVRDRRGVVLLFVDFFDVEGSLACWRKLGALVGHRRRVLVAANKCDLLPNDVSRQRALSWVVRRCKETVPYLRDNLKETDVRLVSCRSGQGIGDLLQDARDAAARARGDVFVCGAANCGKSSFVNRAVGAYSGGQNYKGVKSWGVTASASPGTTLGVVKINLRDDLSLIHI